jgi:hypothetical protein
MLINTILIFRNQVHSSISKLFFDEVIRQNVKSFLSEAERQFGSESILRQNPKIYAKSWRKRKLDSFIRIKISPVLLLCRIRQNPKIYVKSLKRKQNSFI